MREKKCVFAGTFDPPTLGHKKMLEDCLALFDEVVVAIMINPAKTPLFSVEERKEMLALTLRSERMKIVAFSGTAAELLEEENAKAYVRGVRNATDFDYETSNLYATQKLKADVICVYLPCPQELLHISSSVVRTLMQFKKPLDGYVTEEVKRYIAAKTGD